MKKIINGKRYDTDTAKEIETYQYSNRGDFYWYRETLYRKKTGEFFLYGEGGPASKYCESCDGGGWMSGEGFKLLSHKEAREWVEEHANEMYESLFEVKEDDTTVTMTSYSLPADVVDMVRKRAAATGQTQSSIVAQILRDGLK